MKADEVLTGILNILSGQRCQIIIPFTVHCMTSAPDSSDTNTHGASCLKLFSGMYLSVCKFEIDSTRMRHWAKSTRYLGAQGWRRDKNAQVINFLVDVLVAPSAKLCSACVTAKARVG